MADVDLNLLPALEVLLNECSVAAAAGRLGLSESAMSRTLARLRTATGDPLLVRAGRSLVPTPHATALREGLIDLEIGVLGESAPEVRVQALFGDRFVGVVRKGHPLLASGQITAKRYASCGHVVVSRRGRATGPVDDALHAIGLRRTVVAVVSGFAAAVAIARSTDLIALVPLSFTKGVGKRPDDAFTSAMRVFPLPVRTEPITVSQMWHPRRDADPAHRWLRGLVRTACRVS